MKKLLFLLSLCILFSGFAITANSTSNEDEFVVYPDHEYRQDRIGIETEFMVRLEQYEGEGPFDLYGIQIQRIELMGSSLSEEEMFEKYDKCGYVVYIDPEIVSAEDAARTLHAIDGIRAFLVYLDGYDLYKEGDVNGDDTVDTFDCLVVKSIHFGKYEATEEELSRADVNKDGTIDLFDYMEIKAMCFE